MVAKINPQLFAQDVGVKKDQNLEIKENNTNQLIPVNPMLQSGYDSTTSLKTDFKLVRQKSTSHGYGYLFLAVMFCMMCCASFLAPTRSIMADRTMPKFAGLDNSRQLHFSDSIKPEFSDVQLCQSQLDDNTQECVDKAFEKNEETFSIFHELLCG